jgi:polyhydroxybutyrate depolymerase
MDGAPPLERGFLDVVGVRRSYWLAPARRSRSPLIIALHGSGMSGKTMAWLTGLATRGPAAGFTTVFPDGWHGVWHPGQPPPGEQDLDDAAFLQNLSYELEARGVARSWPLFLAGVSNGAFFAEHLARHGLLPVGGLFIVAGSALEFSRRISPEPLLRCATAIVHGTGDRSVPYQGGQLTRSGLAGWVLRRRARRHGEQPGENAVAGALATANDWAAGNGAVGAPDIEELPPYPGDPPVSRLSWTGPACQPVTLYRIVGGGHSWPGDSQLLPARIIGPIARHFDTTGVLLDFAKRTHGAVSGSRSLEAGLSAGGLSASRLNAGGLNTRGLTAGELFGHGG